MLLLSTLSRHREHDGDTVMTLAGGAAPAQKIVERPNCLDTVTIE
jgi:hypothetical protein